MTALARRLPSLELVGAINERAIKHLQANWMDGSDPGLCVAWDGCRAMPALVAFGRRAAVEVVTQRDARAAAAGARLSGHGGTEDGIIGAAAGVGLTADGWNGRLIEYRSVFGHLRDVPEPVSVADLGAAGITVVSIDRDAPVPLPDGLVRADGWLRPRLWAGRPVLPVQRDGAGGWFAPGPRTIGGVENVGPGRAGRVRGARRLTGRAAYQRRGRPAGAAAPAFRAPGPSPPSRCRGPRSDRRPRPAGRGCRARRSGRRRRRRSRRRSARCSAGGRR